jgi:hypothetical protein
LVIRVLAAVDGTLRAKDDGRPASAKSVQGWCSTKKGSERILDRASPEAAACECYAVTQRHYA